MPILLGVDPGLTRCGVAVIDTELRGRVVHTDVIQTSSTTDPAKRVGLIASVIAEVIDRFRPVSINLERVFAQANLRSVMGVAQVSGAIMALGHQRSIRVEFFTPTEVKLAICGSGRASKQEVIRAIQRLYPQALRTNFPDEADAVAIALCAERQGGLGTSAAQRQWIEAARAANRRMG